MSPSLVLSSNTTARTRRSLALAGGNWPLGYFSLGSATLSKMLAPGRNPPVMVFTSWTWRIPPIPTISVSIALSETFLSVRRTIPSVSVIDSTSRDLVRFSTGRSPATNELMTSNATAGNIDLIFIAHPISNRFGLSAPTYQGLRDLSMPFIGHRAFQLHDGYLKP